MNQLKNIRMYVESGMLELYALGDLSSAERLQIEHMAAIHWQIKNELNEIEYALEQYALKNAVATPTSLRHKILDNITGS